MAILRGSHGEISFRPATGEVLKITNENGNEVGFYAGIIDHSPAVIDVREWENNYGRKVTEDAEFDILDFGYYMKNGDYEPPCMDWREEMAKAKVSETGYLPFGRVSVN